MMLACQDEQQQLQSNYGCTYYQRQTGTMGASLILPQLFIGSYTNALDPPAEITALLCVAAELAPPANDRLTGHIPIVDMQPIPADQLRAAVEWIDAHIEHHRILVFCNAGVGRSPSVTIAYLCCALDYGFGQAVEYVATRRPYMSILPDLIHGIAAVKQAWRGKA